MNRWERVDSASVPGGGRMDLYRRAEELCIQVDGRELMNSRVHGSEDALSERAAVRLGPKPGMRVLIGGLGMGWTLAAAVRAFPEDATIVVAELVPEVVKWNRGPIGPVAGNPLLDPRVEARVQDVNLAIREGDWDAILLDVDNGPEGLTSSANDQLYSAAGLQRAKAALRPGGVLGIWSAAPNASFNRRLHQAGFAFDEEVVRARGAAGGKRHTLWFARVSEGPARGVQPHRRHRDAW
jgi:spermidine synthase